MKRPNIRRETTRFRRHNTACNAKGKRLVSWGYGSFPYYILCDSNKPQNRGRKSTLFCLWIAGISGITSAHAQNLGVWSDVISLPNIPVAAAVLPSGKVLSWSADMDTTFAGGLNGAPSQTHSSVFDPATGNAVAALVTSPIYADMFCPGTAYLPDGRILVNGGSSSPKTSIYDPASNTWSADAYMNIPRGYNASATLSTGDVLTLGGSWSGAKGVEKIGEVWSASLGWVEMPGIGATPITDFDPQDTDGVFRGDNHAWLFEVGGGWVFHAGPSAEMHWIDTSGGTISFAGLRQDATDDADAAAYSMNGNAVWYDQGKILTLGGSSSYDLRPAYGTAHVIDLNSSAGPQVTAVAPMAYPRVFANSVVLPTGEVLVVGGQTVGHAFYDDNGVLVPEMWRPSTETFATMAPMQTVRAYHSVALLLPDGRVFSGGGGMCGNGCPGNHFNAEIFSPPYLFNADGSPAQRPVITSAPTGGGLWGTLTVWADGNDYSWAMVRLGVATHSLDNDQRREQLQVVYQTPNQYILQLPGDPGGYWMLFAINARGTPSVAQIIYLQ